MVAIKRLGSVQRAALEIYVLDPIHEETRFRLEGSTLTFEGEIAEGCEVLIEAANSADDDHDHALCRALGDLAKRLRCAIGGVES